ncbi:MAG TPA: hypothetical protein EYP07_13505 [Kiloniellaceae bacterium]|nr:hypothetical protein [Kiloniellaceae bacterium]
MNLRNLICAVLGCLFLALSMTAQAEPLSADVSLQQLEPVAAAVDLAGFTVLAELENTKKRVLKRRSPPGGGGQAPQSLKAPMSGELEFDACCDDCSQPGGCTGCNSGPEGLNCGLGLIAADCQVVNDVVTCVKKD